MARKKGWVLTFEDNKLVLRAKDGKDKIVLMEGLDEKKKKAIGAAITGVLGILYLLGVTATVNAVSEVIQKIRIWKK